MKIETSVVTTHRMKALGVFLFFLFFILLSSFGQVATKFKSVIYNNKINRTINLKSKESVSEITFLGTVNTNYGKTKYYVLKEFLKIKFAGTWHGYSSIYFIDLKFKKGIRYDLGMLENLPYKLSYNKLLFKYRDSIQVIRNYWQDLKPKLPSYLCIAPSDCYPPVQ